jgi:hypothetical protein
MTDEEIGFLDLITQKPDKLRKSGSRSRGPRGARGAVLGTLLTPFLTPLVPEMSVAL